uniref:Uncharacterized protein n=1 Tax=Anguilla anguilla TaxID=7936 RepID=A0A0E9UNX8_ANGAN
MEYDIYIFQCHLHNIFSDRLFFQVISHFQALWSEQTFSSLYNSSVNHFQHLDCSFNDVLLL